MPTLTSAPKAVSVVASMSIALILLTPPAMAGEKLASCPGGAKTSQKKTRGSFSKEVVRAKPAVVYQAIVDLRHQGPNTVKEVSHKGNVYILEERFPSLPLIGKARCVYKEVHTPDKRIEYNMVSSDKFKAFEGVWDIRPIDGGEHSLVSLTSYVDLAIPLPFAGKITRMQTAKGVKDRLAQVKKNSEQAQLSSSKKVGI